MEHYPELEQAEIDLENALRQERNSMKLTRRNKILSDRLIEFAILAHLIAGITSPIGFILIIIMIIDDLKIPIVVVLLILPAGLVSLGKAIGLYRVLEFSKSQRQQNV